jgi:hypothetical protein
MSSHEMPTVMKCRSVSLYATIHFIQSGPVTVQTRWVCHGNEWPRMSGAIPNRLNSRYRGSPADFIRPVDDMAISCFELLSGGALLSVLPPGIVPLGFIRSVGEGRRNRNEHRRAIVAKSTLFMMVSFASCISISVAEVFCPCKFDWHRPHRVRGRRREVPVMAQILTGASKNSRMEIAYSSPWCDSSPGLLDIRGICIRCRCSCTHYTKGQYRFSFLPC